MPALARLEQSRLPETIPDAMKWYERASMANPYDPYSPMRYGMCFDWLDKHDEAAKYFEKALKLAPNDHLRRSSIKHGT